MKFDAKRKALYPTGGNHINVLYIILAVLVFGLLIFVHELGHFLAARVFKVRVNEFALGMGPAIFKYQGERTLYALRLLPIGGYCALDGEDGEASDTIAPKPYTHGENAFFARPLWKKIIILCAGSFMNLLVGFLILVCFYLPKETYPTTTISSLMEGFPQEVELRAGDEILKVNNYSIFYYLNVATYLDHDAGEPYSITVRRDGEEMVLRDVSLERRPYSVEVMYEDGSTGFEQRNLYGFSFESPPLTLGGKLRLAWLTSVDFVRMVWVSLQDLFSGRAGVSDMSGFIGIGAMISTTAQTSMPTMWMLVALIAVNLAVMNLLPIPALDGGRIFFLVIARVVQAVRGKPLNPKYENAINFAGFALLMALMLYVSFNDIMRLIGQ